MSLRDFVLVIDDDPTISGMVTDVLQDWGFKVTTAHDALQAVIQAEAIRPRLIVSDIQMPVFGTGPEALAKMRQVPQLQGVPVIFMTGIPPQEAMQLMPPDPKVRLIYKPIDWMKFRAAIDDLLTPPAPPAA